MRLYKPDAHDGLPGKIEKLGNSGKQFFRIDRDEKLVEVKQFPQWLAGFDGTAANESARIVDCQFT